MSRMVVLLSALLLVCRLLSAAESPGAPAAAPAGPGPALPAPGSPTPPTPTAEVEGPAAVSAAEAALNEVLTAMQKAADGVTDLAADFTYIRYSADFEDTVQKSGHLSFKKPEFVRIDFAKPYEVQRFVTPDRFVEYRPDVDVATVIRRDRTQEREGTETLAVAMGTAPNKLRERFTLALVVDPELTPEERQALRVVELLPVPPKAGAQPSGPGTPASTSSARPPASRAPAVEGRGALPEQVVRVWLWVDAHDWLPRRVKSFARNGDTESFLFTDVKSNQKLADGLFTFTPGPKTVVDDMTANPLPEM